MWEIFKHFLTLGLVSFGGPAAHLGYFQRHFVEKHKWLEAHHYAQLVALSQFLPGPASSQVGFAIGYHQGGLRGALIAFIAFTTPSFLLMTAVAAMSATWWQNPWFMGVVHGLKLFAVVVVADALVMMASKFWRHYFYVVIGLVSALLLWRFPGFQSQLMLFGGAALLGAIFPIYTSHKLVQSKAPKWWPLAIFIGLFFILPLVGKEGAWFALISDFFQAGSLVFGGGHVVLPLLQELLVDQIPADRFLSGYAMAQAMPGPMFSFAAYLGYELNPVSPWLSALIATLAIFLPGFLLMLGLMQSWEALLAKPKLAGAAAAINAAVVGLLLSVWYEPVLASAVQIPEDLVAVIVGFVLMRQLKFPLLLVLPAFALLGISLQIRISLLG